MMKKIISALLVVCLVLGINTSSASAQVKKSFKIRYSFTTTFTPRAGNTYSLNSSAKVVDYAEGICSGCGAYKYQVKIYRGLSVPYNKIVNVEDGIKNATVNLKKDKQYSIYFGTATALSSVEKPGYPYYMMGYATLDCIN